MCGLTTDPITQSELVGTSAQFLKNLFSDSLHDRQSSANLARLKAGEDRIGDYLRGGKAA